MLQFTGPRQDSPSVSEADRSSPCSFCLENGWESGHLLQKGSQSALYLRLWESIWELSYHTLHPLQAIIYRYVSLYQETEPMILHPVMVVNEKGIYPTGLYSVPNIELVTNPLVDPIISQHFIRYHGVEHFPLYSL